MNKAFPLFLLVTAILSACGGGPDDALSRGNRPVVPEDVPGLEIEGPRTRANVLVNMDGAVHSMQAIYQEFLTRDPGLEGELELKLTVEWNGEITRIEVGRSTLNDTAFEKAVLRPIQFLDFDGWSSSEEDTEIVYPIEFEA